jgi:hypothetical protein
MDFSPMLEALAKAHEDLQKMAPTDPKQKKLLTFSLIEIERFTKSIKRFTIATELARLGNSTDLGDLPKIQELKQKIKNM